MTNAQQFQLKNMRICLSESRTQYETSRALQEPTWPGSTTISQMVSWLSIQMQNPNLNSIH